MILQVVSLSPRMVQASQVLLSYLFFFSFCNLYAYREIEVLLCMSVKFRNVLYESKKSYHFL
jgi:hypothetical protein